MKSKVILMVLATLCLSACGHVKKTAKSDDDKPSTAQTSPSPQTQLEPTLEPDIVSDIEVDDITIPTKPVAAKTVDMLDRLRDGFAFPKLLTKDVRQHERWASEHTTYLTNLFNRAEPFLFFIVEEIEKRGLPMELALLPAVESAFDPGAVSRSSAAGLWQFVPATGRGFGLRQDWWYDGRHDPYSSTFAALDYLEQLHAMFDGDWFIALAAYNAGPGTLRREIKRAKRAGRKTDYVSLKLRLETRRYIPKLIALKRIIQNPKKYGVTLPTIASEPYFEVIDLPGQIDLVEFAKQSNIDGQLLRHMNRGFKRWATSPDGPHRLLVPLGANKNLDYAELAIKNTPKVNYRHHKIRQGDTLSGIARTYGVSVGALRSANRLRGTNIRAGHDLLIPVRGTGGKAANKSVSSSLSADQEAEIKHHVKKGDTLWSIARRYQVKLDQLMSWNNLRSGDVLNLNQILRVFPN